MSFHDFLAQHSSAGEFIVLVASCIPAALGTRKLLQEAAEDKGIKKAWRWTELIFLWLLPVMVFLSTKAVDWASDDALKGARAEMQRQIAEAKAAALPKPIQSRIFDVLVLTDPNILERWKEGITNFNGRINAQQLFELSKVAKEPGAENFICITSSTFAFLGDGDVWYDVKFTATAKLLESQKTSKVKNK